MGYRRMNITLPDGVAKRLERVPNKSAFIAKAVQERFKALEKQDVQRRLLASYRYAAAHPEVEEDERSDW